MRILIVGSTGGTGRQLVQEALERGHQVTAFARRPEKLAIQHENLRVVRGDVLDAASVGAAVKSQDAVLSALGHKRWLGPTRILSAGTANLLDAMAAHGVRFANTGGENSGLHGVMRTSRGLEGGADPRREGVARGF